MQRGWKLTKKHFEALALAMRNAKLKTTKKVAHETLRQLNREIMDICENANPNFDRAKYLEVVNQPKEPSKEIPKRMQEKLTIPSE